MPVSIRASRMFVATQGVLLVIFAAVFFWHPDAPLLVSAEASMAGVVIAIAGLLVIALGFVALKDNIQVAPHTKEGAHLVQDGIYRVLRHPIYTGMAICIVGLWLKQPCLSVGVAGAVVIVFLGVKRRIEEEFLLAAYPEYAEYRKRTVALP
jgi:protein-S-isoprenylcysteine O-methyltransferase Ste14